MGVIALAVGIAGALAPQGVEAAGKVFRLAGKSGRVAQVDKRGNLGVAVKNRPSVKVPDGVAVTNQPSVKVPDGVAVTNQPEVKVPEGVDVRAAPGALNADTRASMRDVFAVQGSRVGSGWVSLDEFEAGTRVAITELTISPEGPEGFELYRIEVWVRKDSSEGFCAGVNIGDFDRHILRTVNVRNNETLQLTFADAPLPLPQATAAGNLACFGITVPEAPGVDTCAGATGFTY